MSYFDDFFQLFFNWVVETTIVCSILVGLILVIKGVLRNKLPVSWHYILWIILLIRMILPPLPEGLYNNHKYLPHNNQPSVMKSEQKSQEYPNYSLSSINIDFQDINIPIEKFEQKSEKVSFNNISLYVWMIGVLCMGVVTLSANIKVLHYINNQPLISDPKINHLFEKCKRRMLIKSRVHLVESGQVSSPSLSGFIRPRILLSQTQIEALSDKQLQFIFYHELAHIKRRDVLFNCVINMLLVIHWFNPIMWVAYYYMRQDQEISCDALALSYIEESAKLDYGRTIIKLLEEYSGSYAISTVTNMAGRGHSLKRRIIMIKQYQKKSKRWPALGVVSLILLTGLFFVNVEVSNLGDQNLTVNAATNDESHTSENKKKSIVTPESEVQMPVKTSNDNDNVSTIKDTRVVGLEDILQDAPFKVLIPKELSTSYIHGALMNNVSVDPNERNINISYQTPSGDVHIWESNVDVNTAEKNPLHAPGYKEEKVKIKNHDWYFTPHNDDKELLIFTTLFDNIVVQVSGKVPYNELVKIIASLE